uniref:interferon-induced protein 44-like n=1 Tax=Scatophagus argus TaxID=75038 RepID=UPI001ED810CD|nr:interferon-induced protein 44-like [Scatophagus argus]XP_046270445.1 interferon-induced protein 44-like [Scatophagus argus]XP_046270446.1 interferon-induced protein 44-like [Scatophagus argus]XP_046270447.1 interferon-induced protein 44-like [Scatophagus argus]
MGGALFSQPWRPLPKNNENLNFVNSYQPQNNEISSLRILLHGPAGAGKSSFISSVDSVLQGRISGRALSDTIGGKSFTQIYKTFRFRKNANHFHPFIMTDIMGLEKNERNGVPLEDLKLALKGHVKEGYKFIPGQQISDPSYNSSPTLDDRVHVLVCVFPAGSASLISDEVVKKMREVRLAASEMGIPQLAILTKVDEACPNVKQSLKNIYKSKYLKEQAEKFSMLLGLPLNCIFLVKNYESELTTTEDVNAPILYALRQMITFGEDFLNDLNS